VGKFDDDLHLVAPSDFVPPTVNALLEHAGAVEASRTEQAAAIRAWLKTHRPSPMMVFSIRKCGFAELLDAPTAV
jgi:hypothetical protein